LNSQIHVFVDLPPRQVTHGQLALAWSGKTLPLVLLESAAGFYIGTFDPNFGPCSRESQEYFGTLDQARAALAAGTWTQRVGP